MVVPMVVCSACGAGAGCACHGAGAALHPFLPGCHSSFLCPGALLAPLCLDTLPHDAINIALTTFHHTYAECK